MNKKAVFALGGAGLFVLLAYLAFGFFGIQAAFIDNEVSEGGPEFASGAQAAETTSEAATEDATKADSTTAEQAAEPETGEEPADESTSQAEPTVTTEKLGSFSSLGSYSVSGDVSVLTDGNQRFVSLADNFSSSNGPDLKVYLRADSGEFLNLGNLKGNIGDQNYEVPIDVDLDTFSKIEIWCERFSVGFGEATLS